MATRVAALALAVPALSEVPALSQHDLHEEFSLFKRYFNRIYDDGEEEIRFHIFSKNRLRIQAWNAEDTGATYGVNMFTDMTPEEFRFKYANLKVPLNGTWGVPFQGVHEYHEGDSLVSEIDWVKKGAVTPVKDQGQCGSCWAFSTTGVIESRYEIASGTLVSLSEQEFVDCETDAGGCQGGFPANSLKWAENHDVCTEASYSYRPVQGSCRKTCTKVGIPKGTITGYKMVAKNKNAFMSALQEGPLSIGVDAEGPFMSYSGGIMTKACGTQLDHAVLAVGYTSQYWKVKNSWGTSWGEAGYIRIGHMTEDDRCGLLNSACYPMIAGASNSVVV